MFLPRARVYITGVAVAANKVYLITVMYWSFFTFFRFGNVYTQFSTLVSSKLTMTTTTSALMAGSVGGILFVYLIVIDV